MNSFNEDCLVFKEVTLASKVEVMVNIRADFLGLSVFSKESSKNSLSSHPEDLYWHSCVSGSLSLTEPSMSSLSLGLMNSLASRSRVDMDLSLHDKTIMEQFSNVLP